MNPQERLAVWEGLNAQAAQTLAETDQDFSGIEVSMREKIRTGRQASVNMTAGWIKFYSEKVLTS